MSAGAAAVFMLSSMRLTLDALLRGARDFRGAVLLQFKLDRLRSRRARLSFVDV
jgi:hypothetical protein